MKRLLLGVLLLAPLSVLAHGDDPLPYVDPMTLQMERYSTRVREDGMRQIREAEVRQRLQALEERNRYPDPQIDQRRSPWIDHPTCIGPKTCGDLQYIRR